MKNIRREQQTPCQYCGRYYSRRGLINHERRCASNSTPGSNVTLKGHALGNVFESVTSVSCWMNDPCRTFAQTCFLFFLCGLIRELITTGFGFIAEKGLAGNEETIREGLTSMLTTWMRIRKQANANIRLEDAEG